MIGKNLSCKLDCSQAYHCLHMADQQSIELLPFTFNFARRTIAYRRLAQGLNRSLLVCFEIHPQISRSSHQIWPMCTKLWWHWHSCQYPSKTDQNLRALFQCLTKADLKLSMVTCHCGVQEVDFFVPTVIAKVVAPQKQEIAKFFEKSNFQDPRKHSGAKLDFWTTSCTIYLGWQNYSLSFPNYSKQRMPKQKLRSPLTLTKFREVDEAKYRCYQLSLRLPLPGKQLLLLTVESFQAAC